MIKLRELLAQLRSDESGATAIEYGLLAALVAVAILAVVTILGQQLRDTFQNVSDGLATAGIPAGGGTDPE
jgi:pilus assembly protein Flp/PilA